MLALVGAQDLPGLRDLADVRVGPVVGGPDEVVWNPIAGFPGSDVAVRLGEGALYHLVHSIADDDVRADISTMLASAGLDHPVVVSTFLTDALVEGFELDLTGAPPTPINHVLSALNTFTLGGEFDPEEAKAAQPKLTRTADILNLLSRYNGLKGATVLPYLPDIGARFTPRFSLDDLRTIGLAGERTGAKVLQSVWKLVKKLADAPAADKPGIETQLQAYMTSLATAARSRDLPTIRTLSQGV